MLLQGIQRNLTEAEPISAEDFAAVRTAAASATATAAAAPATPPAPAGPSVDDLLREQGIDLATLNPDLASAIRSKITVTDGKADLSGLYFNGAGDDLANRVNGAITGLNNWQSGFGTIQYGEGSDYTYSVAEMAANGGGYNILPYTATDASALPTLNALSGVFRQMPLAPKELTPVEAAVFDRLVSQTGDGNWARLQLNDLRGALHALTPNADGTLNLSGIYGGTRGFDPTPPSDTYARQIELTARTEEFSSAVQYGYYVPDGFDSSRWVSFTPPDTSVGSIVMEERGGGGDDGRWLAPVYKPSADTVAKYEADIAAYNATFGRLTENNLVQVRSSAGGGLNVGNDFGYLSAGGGAMVWTPEYGLITSNQNIKYPEEDGFLDMLGDIVEVVVPMVIGAVFAYVGGPVGSFVFNYVMSDGDLEKAFLGAATTYVTSGMGAAFDGAAAGASAASTTGLAASLGITDTMIGAAVNNGAASALGAAASGEDLEGVLVAGAIGAAAGAAGNYVTTSLPTSIGSEAARRAIGNSVTTLTDAALSGEDLGDAAMLALAGSAGALVGDSLFNSGIAGNDNAARQALVSGTSALSSGLANTVVNDTPLATAVGQALGAGMSGYVQATPLSQATPAATTGDVATATPDTTDTGEVAQSFPVREPGEIITRPLEEAPPRPEAAATAQPTAEYDEWGLPIPAETPPPRVATPEPETGSSTATTLPGLDWDPGSWGEVPPPPARDAAPATPAAPAATQEDTAIIGPLPESGTPVTTAEPAGAPANDPGLDNWEGMTGPVAASTPADTTGQPTTVTRQETPAAPATTPAAPAPAAPPVTPSDQWGRWDRIAAEIPTAVSPSTSTASSGQTTARASTSTTTAATPAGTAASGSLGAYNYVDPWGAPSYPVTDEFGFTGPYQYVDPWGAPSAPMTGPFNTPQSLQDQIDARRWLYATRVASNLGVEPAVDLVASRLNAGNAIVEESLSTVRNGSAAVSRFTGVGLMGGLGTATSITTAMDQFGDGTAGGGWRGAASLTEASNFFRMYMGGLYALAEWNTPMAQRTTPLGQMTNTLLGTAGDRFGLISNFAAGLFKEFGLDADYDAAMNQTTSQTERNRLTFEHNENIMASRINTLFEMAPYSPSGLPAQAPMWGVWLTQKLTDTANVASSGVGTTGFRPVSVGGPWASINSTINSATGAGPTVPPIATPSAPNGYSTELQQFLNSVNYTARVGQNAFDNSVGLAAGLGMMSVSANPAVSFYTALTAPSAVNNTLNAVGNSFIQTPADRAAALRAAGLDPAADPRAATYNQPTFVRAAIANAAADMKIAYLEGVNYTNTLTAAERALMQQYDRYSQPSIRQLPETSGPVTQAIYNAVNSLNISSLPQPPIIAARAAGNVVGLYDRATTAVQQAATQAQTYVTSTAATVSQTMGQAVNSGAAAARQAWNSLWGTTPAPTPPPRP